MDRIKKILECEQIEYIEFKEKQLSLILPEVERIKGEKPSVIVESGIANGRISKLYYGYAERLIQYRLDLRRKYSQDEPRLLSKPLLSDMECDLKEFVAAIAKSYIDEDQRSSLETSVTRAILLMKLKKDLGLNDLAEGKIMTFNITNNISNSAIAALNLGTVLGGINATVNDLQSQGHKNVAEGIDLLLKAITSDETLGAERKAMIESLATIGEQATLPEERRRVDVVKTCLKSLADGVRVSADAAKVWEVFGPTIASYFHLAFDSLT
ncbi:MAG: hypothetical protein JNN08_12215 [Bryobacterales bacterium]|nr:hypothetical protein [Bryobacterales bacterium]